MNGSMRFSLSLGAPLRTHSIGNGQCNRLRGKKTLLSLTLVCIDSRNFRCSIGGRAIGLEIPPRKSPGISHNKWEQGICLVRVKACHLMLLNCYLNWKVDRECGVCREEAACRDSFWLCISPTDPLFVETCRWGVWLGRHKIKTITILSKG